MRRDSKRRKHGLYLVLTSVLAVACLAATPQPATAETRTGSGSGISLGEQSAARTDSGMIVYIDPSTGEVLPAPAPGTQPLQLSPAERNALSTSHAGLVQVPSSVPGGGVKLDLRGRFQSPFIAVVGADGTATVRHLEELPWTGDKP
jgi:hypothetical protein